MTKKSKITWGVIGGLVALILITFISTQNSLAGKDVTAKQCWADVQAQYQRRANLVPQLVNTVKGYASHEKQTLEGLTEARTKATQIRVDADNLSEADMRRFQEAQGELSQALGRLIAITEAYPDLKASQNFSELQAQLEGTENRIAESLRKYNEAVRNYNKARRMFPTNVFAGMLGYEALPNFEAQAGADKAPEVSFD
ncbi:MAG: LemA family protein [Bacteroidales bacterium]|nr:LemA family protein [Bacteroidales bacterium]